MPKQKKFSSGISIRIALLPDADTKIDLRYSTDFTTLSYAIDEFKNQCFALTMHRTLTIKKQLKIDWLKILERVVYQRESTFQFLAKTI